MLSNRLDWNRVERLVSAKVDQSHQKSISKTKKILSKWPRKEVVDFVQSNDSSQLMSTRHTGNRFPRHFEKHSASDYEGGWRCCRIERLDAVDVDPSYRKSISKTLRKYSTR